LIFLLLRCDLLLRGLLLGVLDFLRSEERVHLLLIGPQEFRVSIDIARIREDGSLVIRDGFVGVASRVSEIADFDVVRSLLLGCRRGRGGRRA
jgi:hypothetical protein